MTPEQMIVGCSLLVASLTLSIWSRIEIRSIQRDINKVMPQQAARIQALRYAISIALKALDDKSNTAKDHARNLLNAAMEVDRVSRRID